jgi:acyl-coenzyme A synthetase/AMP-(fatty) acid ligase
MNTKLASILSTPARPFLRGAPQTPHPMTLARRLMDTLADTPGERICLAVQDKGALAAALIAAAAGDTELVLPFALTPRVVSTTCREMGVTRVLTDGSQELPSGLEEIKLDTQTPGQGREEALPPIDAARAFLLLYTGGTTGAPQVWTKTPGGLFGEALFLADAFGIGPEDHVVATVPVQHIYGLLFSVLLPLVSGATTTNEIPYYPREIRRVVAEEGASVLVSSPGHYKTIGSDPPAAGALRLAFSSGGFLDPGDGAIFKDAVGFSVTEVYGSTETGGIAARNRGDGEELWRPFAPVDCVIRDDRLLVRSPFMSPELTVSGAGFFRTGDRASDAGGGRFHLLGRIDGVVKIGSKRVVVEEVRAKLLGLAGVKDALVLALPAGRGRGTSLAALVESEVEVSALRRLAAEVLEAHAVPRPLRLVAQIPRAPTGKIDRARALKLLGSVSDVDGARDKGEATEAGGRLNHE